jgi:hypothetical protein
MKRLSILSVTGLSLMLLTACAGRVSLASSPEVEFSVPTAVPETMTPAPSETPLVLSATFTPATPLTPTVTSTPTLAPDAWQFMPIVPMVGDTARHIYAAGQLLGNDPHAFSILGDCLSLPINLFGNYGKDPSHYDLGEYTFLQPVIDWFKPSFNRVSLTLHDGFNTAAILSPLRADPDFCQPNETPLVCEYRIHRPSYALISLGTDDNKTPPDVYEQRMRQIVEYTISQGIIPILATKADNREGNNAFNEIVAHLAYEYDVPLWNFWAAVQPLKNHGLTGDDGHLSWADPNNLEYTYSMEVAIPVRNVTALETLGAVWRRVTTP